MTLGAPKIALLPALLLTLRSLALCGAAPASAEDALRRQAKGLFAPSPQYPPVPPNNPATPEKMTLGKMLYFEPRISESHELSRQTRHNLGFGGVAGQSSTLGCNGQLDGRKAPTPLNASQFADKRVGTRKEQA